MNINWKGGYELEATSLHDFAASLDNRDAPEGGNHAAAVFVKPINASIPTRLPRLTRAALKLPLLHCNGK